MWLVVECCDVVFDVFAEDFFCGVADWDSLDLLLLIDSADGFGEVVVSCGLDRLSLRVECIVSVAPVDMDVLCEFDLHDLCFGALCECFEDCE